MNELLSTPSWKAVSILILLSFISYSPTILNPAPVDIDYEIVIEPLRQIKSFEDYSRALDSNKILDVLPVRDLSLKIDLVISDMLGFQVHGFFNVFFWVLSGVILVLISSELGLKQLSLLIAGTFIFHPVASWVVSWPSARKHILALLFISLATYLSILLKKNRLRFESLIVFSYALAVFSQPISLLWPAGFFFLFHNELKSKKHLDLFYLLILVCALGAGINYFYYGFVYEAVTGSPKLIETPVDLAISISGISRSLSQIFLPFVFAYDYVKADFYTLAGLPLFVVFLFYCLKKLSLRMVIVLAALVLGPLLIIYRKTTNIFVTDTYIIIPLYFCVLLFGLAMRKVTRKWLVACWLLVIVLFATKNIYEQTISNNEGSYYRKSYERQYTCRNILPFADYLLRVNELEKFIEIFNHAIGNNCTFGGSRPVILVGRLYTYRLLLDKEISLKQKAERLDQLEVYTPDLKWMKDRLNEYFSPMESPLKNETTSPLEDLRVKTMMFACSQDPDCKPERLIYFLNNNSGS
jgi:hypothetical protein